MSVISPLLTFLQLNFGTLLKKNNLEADEIIKFNFDFSSWKST